MNFDFPTYQVGQSRHVSVHVSATSGYKEKQLATRVYKAAEIHYNRVAGFFRSSRYVPHVNLIIGNLTTSAGYHYGGIHDVYASILPGYGWDYTSAIFVAELAELFSEARGCGWNGTASDHGEAMSRFIMSAVVPKTLGSIDRAAIWWNNRAPDCISRASNSYNNGTVDGGDNGIGCAYVFLRYLRKLGFTPDKILAIDSRPNLELVFRRLTGRRGGYVEMMKILLRTYPRGQSAVNDSVFS
jgi:hypothetical protein